MRYLLDTHTAIWALGNDSDVNLSKNAKSIIADTSNLLYVSIASAWELAIKVSIKKIEYNGGVSSFLAQLRENGIDLIGVEGSHVELVETLPFIHRDPFDRLLIATAIENKLTILTADEDIKKYDVPCVW
jgi:PIN domain nuclease of toxin-antitoxin system